MKHCLILSVFCLSVAASVAGAQTLQAPVSAGAQASVPTASLALGWSETLRMFDFAVNNGGSKALTVIGVQSTANLYVVDFPKTIPANGTANFSLLFSASSNSTGPSEFLHVLTDQGDRAFQFNHERAQVIQLTPASLQWSVGDPLTPKTITLTIPGNQTIFAGVTASGTGNIVTEQPEPGGQYVITVTPGSTVQENRFIVSIFLNPSLPGVVPIVLCSVGQQ